VRRRIAIAGAVAVLAVGGAALGYVLWVRDASRDVRGSSTEEFVTTDIVAPSLPAAPKPRPKPRPRPQRPGVKPKPVAPPVEGVVWPTYGFDARRLRAVGSPLRPPLRRLWTFRGQSLIEFPPAIAYGRLYFSTNHGRMLAVNATTGKRAWRYDSGRCVASSPTVADGVVYQSFLNRPPCNAKDSERLDGEVVAFAAGFGRIQWRRRIGPTESSPLVADGRVFVGDWRGDVHALAAETGKPVWSFHTGGAVKGALALAGGILFVGSYDHHVYALDERTGKLRWRAAAQERLGFKQGTFYSTPAVGYGRVYIGCTDGKVYSFGAASGKLRWSHGTGGYVYASPAVWHRLVLVGAYNGAFLALDAATGEERWRFQANGPISGSATVLGDVVWFSTLSRRTYALDARTGRELWSYPDGKYAGVLADAKRVYLVGYTRVYGMAARR
jgi:outer membrane protein assembly factor BamB